MQIITWGLVAAKSEAGGLSLVASWAILGLDYFCYSVVVSELHFPLVSSGPSNTCYI